MTDDELLALIRADATPAAVGVAIAARHHAELDERATVASMMAATGFSKATVYRGRAWLDEHAPGWRAGMTLAGPGREAAPQAAPATSNGHHPAALAVRPTRARAQNADLAAVEAPVGPPPAWRVVLAELVAAMRGRRSWDLYRDVYAPAADRMLAEGDLGDLIALTVDYLERVTGDDVDTDERKRLAKLVRSHGKAALFGLSEAVPRTDTQTVAEYVRYATTVAANVRARIREGETDG